MLPLPRIMVYTIYYILYYVILYVVLYPCISAKRNTPVCFIISNMKIDVAWSSVMMDNSAKYNREYTVSPVLSTCYNHFIPIVGVGNERRILIGP